MAFLGRVRPFFRRFPPAKIRKIPSKSRQKPLKTPFKICSFLVEAVADARFILVFDDHRKAHVFHAPKDILLDLRVVLCESCDEFLHLFALAVLVSSVGKFASAAQKFQLVVVAPRDDVPFADEVHRADEFHPLEIFALHFGEHGLHLSAVEHPHENGLDDVVKVVAEGNFVAPERLRLGVKVAPPHPRAEIARRFFYGVHACEDVRLEDGDGHAEKRGVFFDAGTVFRAVPGIHDEKHKLKRKFAVAL